MRIDVLTIFPDLFEPVLSASIPGRARTMGAADYHIEDIRAHTIDKHNKVDDRPFGGGPGMVMMCQPVWDAVQAVEARDERTPTRILMTPQGEPLTQPLVEELAGLPRLLIVAGHYEGIDERVVEKLRPREISIGDYVLSGGELAALVLIDAVVRLLPGVLGDPESAAQDSFGTAPTTDPIGKELPRKVLRELGLDAGDGDGAARLLDCPHYTRPREWEGMAAPDVLFSGDHQAVARWRLERMLERTRERRPDLLDDPASPERE